MDAKRLKGIGDGFVRLRLPKGLLLILPVDQYVAGLRHGKTERRAQRFANHNAEHHAEVAYEPQAWTTKAGHYGPRHDRPTQRPDDDHSPGDPERG